MCSHARLCHGIRIEARRSQAFKPQRVMELARADRAQQTASHHRALLRAARAVILDTITPGRFLIARCYRECAANGHVVAEAPRRVMNHASMGC
jgi:hypothetical protein